jgi:type IV pilus assembly protein PilY1
VVAKTTSNGDVVLVTSGYDNGESIGDGKGRMWMLNATSGAVIKTFRTTQGSTSNEAGLAHVSAFKDADGTVRYVYGGDLLGNLWRFDLESTTSGEIDGTLIATLKDSSGNTQPVTAAPELTRLSGKRIILVGTGRVLDLNDFGNTRTQSFYAIADGSTLASARAGLVARTYVRATDTFSGAAFNWATDRGWYFDLPSGEQQNTEPVIAYGAITFTTNVNGSSDCSQLSYLYLVDIGTGLKVPPTSSYPTPFGSIQLSPNATSSRAVVLRTRSGKVRALCHLSDNSSCGAELPLGAAIKPGKNAWREIRR